MLERMLLGTLVAGVLAASANGAIVVTTDPVSYSAAPGDDVAVPVYLMETDAEVGRIASEGGLIAAAFSAIPSVGNSSAISFAPNLSAFDPPATTNNLGGGGVEVILANFFIDPAAVPNPADGRLMLGTLHVTAGTLSTTFQLNDNDLGTDGTSTLAGPLDAVLVGSDFSVTVVPEPTTLLGLATAVLMLMRRPSK